MLIFNVIVYSIIFLILLVIIAVRFINYEEHGEDDIWL